MRQGRTPIQPLRVGAPVYIPNLPLLHKNCKSTTSAQLSTIQPTGGTWTLGHAHNKHTDLGLFYFHEDTTTEGPPLPAPSSASSNAVRCCCDLNSVRSARTCTKISRWSVSACHHTLLTSYRSGTDATPLRNRTSGQTDLYGSGSPPPAASNAIRYLRVEKGLQPFTSSVALISARQRTSRQSRTRSSSRHGLNPLLE